MRTAVIAIGGNALIGRGERGSSQEELGHARSFAASAARMIADGWSIVVTHGNGPQVGFVLRRAELTVGLDPTLPSLTLDHCVAETQGGLGYLLTLSLSNALRALDLPDKVAAVVTRVVVSRDDPAFARPAKPIGGFYTATAAERLKAALRWTMVADPADRGYRRVVPSPEPAAIPETAAIGSLLERGYAVVAAGGGGIPVSIGSDGQQAGTEAVVDKDLTSSMLASDLGADTLILCTDVPAVARDFGKPTQTWLPQLCADEAQRLLGEGQFPPGSMGPKVRAAIRFTRSMNGWGEALITSTEHLTEAMAGRAGTRIKAAPVFAYP